LHRPSGTVVEELIHPFGIRPDSAEPARDLTVALVRGGQILEAPRLDAARELTAGGLRSLPWEGLALSHGEPAIPTRQVAMP